MFEGKGLFLFSILPLKDIYLYQTFIFRYYKHTVHNWWNWYLLEIYGREWTTFNNWSPRLSLYLKRRITIWQDSTVAIIKIKRLCPYYVHINCAPYGHRTFLKLSASSRLENGKALFKSPGWQLIKIAEFWRKKRDCFLSLDLLLQSYTVKVQEIGQRCFLGLFRYLIVDLWRFFNSWRKSLKCLSLFKAILFPSILSWKTFP